MRRLVLDSSVALSWCFAEEATPVTRAALDCIPTAEVIVPSLWYLEVANVLVISERRGRITATEAGEFLQMLGRLPIRVDFLGAQQALATIVDLAGRYGLTAYDAAYLELAIREGAELATLDDRLRGAAAAAGIRSFSP